MPTHRITFSDLRDHVAQLRAADDWKAFRAGVTAHWLYGEGSEGASAVFLRYQSGARVPEHEHVGYEHILVVEGEQFDEHGAYPAGSFVVNPPGTRHSPGSVGGCVVLVIYEKPVRFTSD